MESLEAEALESDDATVSCIDLRPWLDDDEEDGGGGERLACVVCGEQATRCPPAEPKLRWHISVVHFADYTPHHCRACDERHALDPRQFGADTLACCSTPDIESSPVKPIEQAIELMLNNSIQKHCGNTVAIDRISSVAIVADFPDAAQLVALDSDGKENLIETDSDGGGDASTCESRMTPDDPTPRRLTDSADCSVVERQSPAAASSPPVVPVAAAAQPSTTHQCIKCKAHVAECDMIGHAKMHNVLYSRLAECFATDQDESTQRPPAEPKPEPDPLLACQSCSARCNTSDEMARHYADAHLPFGLQRCTLCLVNFKLRKDATAHVRQSHKGRWTGASCPLSDEQEKLLRRVLDELRDLNVNVKLLAVSQPQLVKLGVSHESSFESSK